MSRRPLWGYIPARLRWPDTIPSFRRRSLGEGFIRSNVMALVRMPYRWKWGRGKITMDYFNERAATPSETEGGESWSG